METKRSRASGGAIAASVLITLVWATIAFLVVAQCADQWWLGLLAGLFYAVVHPVVGKIWTAIALALCRAIDRIFEPRVPWGAWSIDGQMVFASLWPVTGLPTVVFTAVGVVFGFMFRVLFR